jgi:hypothetical protein
VIKCRAILKNGTVVFGWLEDTYSDAPMDLALHIKTHNPKPNDMVRVYLKDCKKITMTTVKDGNADDQDHEGGE